MAKKVVFEVDEDCIGRIYINGKKLEEVSSVKINAEPFNYIVEVEQNKRDENGNLVIEDDTLLRTKKVFRFGEGG